MGCISYNLTNQILYYYLFHKKLELFFTRQYNPFINNNNESIKLENYYIISKDLIKKWEIYCNYYLYQAYLDKMNLYNISLEEYIYNVRTAIEKLNKELTNNDIYDKFKSGANVDTNWCSRNILKKEDFDNIIDETAYQYFKIILPKNLISNIKGIITNDKLIILYENIFQMKFLYHGKAYNQGIENNNSLIQLTANFSQFSNGEYDNYFTRNAYDGFKKLIQSNINFVFKLFDNKNINYSKQETISFSKDIGNGISINYNFNLTNDNLSSVNMEQINKNKFPNNQPQNNNPPNNNINNINNNNNNYQQMNNYNYIINNYILENNELKRQLNEERNKNQLLHMKVNQLYTEINQLNIQLQEIKSKYENNVAPNADGVLKLPTGNVEGHYDPSSMKQDDKLISVNFVSNGDNDIGHFSLICKKRDLFVELEARLYNKFPKYKKYETYFIVNTRRIKRFLSLEQNNIKNNDIISIFKIEEVFQ